MASSSSSSFSSSSSSSFSSSSLAPKHEVFLSFRGEDTRGSFTSHLYAALRRKKIATYIDYRLEKGDEISPALISAIGRSRISVIVFSESYASSTWCLDELAHILSSREERGQIVIPVFYRVDPSHVRKQEGSFGAAFAALERRFGGTVEIERVRRWRRALTTAANLSGWDSSAVNLEAELVEQIVEDVLKKLKLVSLVKDEYKGLVGIQKHIEKIESMLHIGSPDVRFICIWGMSGIGKTTLARIVFDRIASQFEGGCFVEKIDEKVKTLGSEGLRNDVFAALFDEKTSNNAMQIRLRHTKALIVLDDLNNWQQIRLLAGEDDWFGPESRIIVTTRDKQLVKNQIGDDHIYEVQALNNDESLELFRLHAFKKISLTVDCVEISKTVVNYCRGNPLALTVLGRSFGVRSEEKWKETLQKLRNLPNDDVQSVLEISYDGLDRIQKEIFLDIACFFEGEDRDHVERILNACDFFATIGIDDLIDKALVTVVNNKLRMHSLLQEMGREIVRQQSVTNPAERSRIWLAGDVYNVFRDSMGTQKIEGIVLDTSEISKEVIYLSPTIFQMMLNLRLLKIYNRGAVKKCHICLLEDLRYLPNKLRYLHWDEYPTRTLPANFTAEYLVELIMPNSQVEKLWNGVKNLTNLRKIDLSYSENLSDISNLAEAINLEHVYLEYCGSLNQVPSHLEHLDKLKTLVLEGCSSMEVFPKLPKNIECLILTGTGIEHVPSSIGCLTQLQILSMRDCERLVSLPDSICKLESLYSLSLTGCSKLERFPEISEQMRSLTILELNKTSIEYLPITIGNLIGIQSLNLECHKLTPHNKCKSKFSKCLSLLQLLCWTQRRSVLPFEFFYEKDCPTMEIASVSRNSFTQGRGKEFLFFNFFQFERYGNWWDNRSKLKFLHTEIQRRSKAKQSGFVEADLGVCYHLDTEIPNWFRYRFENSSAVKIRLNMQEITTLSGFAICAVVDFGNSCFRSQKFKLLCQAHYQLSDGRLLSWDFYWFFNPFVEIKTILAYLNNSRKRFYSLSEEGQEKFTFIHDMIVPEAVFDFYFVDENNEPLQGFQVKRCGIHLLFREDFSKKLESRGQVPSRDEIRDPDFKEEDKRTGGSREQIAVSISRSQLSQHLHQRCFLVYGFLQLCGRDGLAYPKIEVIDQEILEFSKSGTFGGSAGDIGAFCIGNELPDFRLSYAGSRMWIDLPPDFLDNFDFLGFVLCAAVEFRDLHRFRLFNLRYKPAVFVAEESWGSYWSSRDSSTFSCYSENADYSNFQRYLKDKADRMKNERPDCERFISYEFGFELRCVDENCEPLGDDQCEIRWCGIKHLFADEIRGVDLSSGRGRQDIVQNKHGASDHRLKKLFRMVNFMPKKRNI